MDIDALAKVLRREWTDRFVYSDYWDGHPDPEDKDEMAEAYIPCESDYKRALYYAKVLGCNCTRGGETA